MPSWLRLFWRSETNAASVLADECFAMQHIRLPTALALKRCFTLACRQLNYS